MKPSGGSPIEISSRSRQRLLALAAVTAGIMAALLLVFSVELGFRLFMTEEHATWLEDFNCRQKHPFLAIWYKPDCATTWKRIEHGETLFSCRFSTDRFGRRRTPDPAPTADGVALFFGGSGVLGAGVNDGNTLPAYFQRFAPGFAAYNYGGGGFGPQQMLAMLTKADVRAQITLPRYRRTVLIYVVTDMIFPVAIGAMGPYLSYARYFPYYELGADGTLVDRGNFASGRSLRSGLYDLIGQSHLAGYFHVDLSKTLSDHDVETAVRIIDESRRRFKRDFDSDDFYVMIWPGSEVSVQKRALKLFQERKFRILDYSDMHYAETPENVVGDGHPGPRIQERFAARLAKDILHGPN
ncbi:MAG: hypothetical protein HY074_15055 [Deltaproteobacteria bacterium]|nr:hypothetical protein [Deltaproteobacteria bacterium]